MADYTPAQIDRRIQDDPEMQELAKNDETEFLSRHAKLYEEFGYQADGTPHSTAVKGINKVSKFTGIDKDIVQGVANMPVPIATTLAGGALGTLGLGPGPGTLAGASLGSMAGEEINYKLGLRDKPGAVDLGIAAAAPALGPLLSRMKPGIANLVQGSPGAGKHMHNLVAETIVKQSQHMEVTDDMVALMRQNFNNVPAFKTDVPLVRAHLREELENVQKSLTNKFKPVKGTNYQQATDPYITKLKTTIENMKDRKSFGFDELMATEKSFIEMGAEDPTGVWKKLSGVLVTDLEAQAANPKLHPQTREKILNGVEAYKNFVAVNKRKQGQTAIDSFLNKSTTQLDDGLIRFNKPAFMKSLDSDGMKVFEPTEIADMKKAVADLGYIGAAPKSVTSAAVHTGSYGAAGLGAYAVGGVTGVVTLAAVLGAMRLAMSTDMGRKLVTHLAKKGHGKIEGAELTTMMGQLTAGANAGAVAGVSGMGTQPPSGVKPFTNQE